MMNMSSTPHPNPVFERRSALILDGDWTFEADPTDEGEAARWFERKRFADTVRVPHVVRLPYTAGDERAASETDKLVYWYAVSFKSGDVCADAGGAGSGAGSEALLHFGAVDYSARVWLNGVYIGGHEGGYTPFTFEIRRWMQPGENVLVVRVEDKPYEKTFPRGKQTWHHRQFGCWYEGISGIWQSVWLERVGSIYLKQIFLTPDIDEKTVTLEYQLSGSRTIQSFEGKNLRLELDIAFDGMTVAHADIYPRGEREKITLPIQHTEHELNGVKVWRPETPCLYTARLTLSDAEGNLDEAQSYFGMRKISAAGGVILLNNEVYYQKLVLFQGYYADGYFIGSDEQYIRDINLIKEYGYNGIRVHEKIENPRFLYWCDRLGLLVWEEMPSNYAFSGASAALMTRQLGGVIERDYNHPCVCVYVLFNESWGIPEVRTNKQQQALVQGCYYLAKSLDQTRLVIGNDGWEHTVTDIVTVHDYSVNGKMIASSWQNKEETLCGTASAAYPRFVFAEGYGYSGQPVMISEYGGISFAEDNGWGYNEKVRSEEEFLRNFEDITRAIQNIPCCSGYCYTQYNDVEHEMNGLVTMKRKEKVNKTAVCVINRKI